MAVTNVMFAIKVGDANGSAREILARAIWRWLRQEFDEPEKQWAWDLADALIDELKPAHSAQR